MQQLIQKFFLSLTVTIPAGKGVEWLEWMKDMFIPGIHESKKFVNELTEISEVILSRSWDPRIRTYELRCYTESATGISEYFEDRYLWSVHHRAYLEKFGPSTMHFSVVTGQITRAGTISEMIFRLENELSPPIEEHHYRQ